MILTLMKTIWRRWKGVAHGIIRAQNWTLMAITYFVAVGPVAVIMRLKHKDLTDRGLGDPEGQHVLRVHVRSHGVAAPELDRQGLHAAKRPDRDWLRARLC